MHSLPKAWCSQLIIPLLLCLPICLLHAEDDPNPDNSKSKKSKDDDSGSNDPMRGFGLKQSGSRSNKDADLSAEQLREKTLKQMREQQAKAQKEQEKWEKKQRSKRNTQDASGVGDGDGIGGDINVFNKNGARTIEM